jgi:hypothetical protein
MPRPDRPAAGGARETRGQGLSEGLDPDRRGDTAEE